MISIKKNRHKSTPRSRQIRYGKKLYILAFLGFALLLAGGYLAYILFSPAIQKKSPEEIKAIAQEPIKEDKDAIFIPAVGVQAEIAQGDSSILDKGLAWNRLPKQGSPISGGNMVITGHSFVWGLDPKQVKQNSIFYDLKNTKVGDEVLINWQGKQYKYAVQEVKQVKPNAVEIEYQSSKPRLTIYTCTPGGAADGRVVVVAVPSS